MVDNHARKTAIRVYMRDTGVRYQEACAVVRNQPTKYLHFPVSVLGLEGVETCPACTGTGLKGGLAGAFQSRNIGRRYPVLIPAACMTCRGCGHATHYKCPPFHAGDAPAMAAAYFAQRGADGDHEPPCRTCHGRLHFFELGIGATELIPDTPEIAEHKAARHARGEFSDSGFPDGYSLSVPNGLEYLRYPCDCVPDSTAQVVSRTQLTFAASDPRRGRTAQ